MVEHGRHPYEVALDADRSEMAQAIPPAYTEHIGHQLMQAIRSEQAA